MDSAKKMVLVPPDVLNRLNTTKFTKMDKDMYDILYSNTSTDSEKWKLYNETLYKYLHEVRESEKPIAINILNTETVTPKDVVKENPPLNEDVFLDNINKILKPTFRIKGNNLYNILKASAHISWNEAGEIKVEGREIPNSNITSLIVNSVKSKGTPINPVGWAEYMRALVKSNIPDELLGRNITKNFIQVIDSPERPIDEQQRLIGTPQNTTSVVRVPKAKAGRYAPYLRSWKHLAM